MYIPAKRHLLPLLACFLALNVACNDEMPGDSTPATNTGRYPNYNTDPLPPDPTGMTSNASQLASKMTIGWNMGNTLEAIGGETAWGTPMVTPELDERVAR